MIVDKEILEAAKQEAKTRFPNESCGLIVSGKYLPCTNISETPDKDFRINDAETLPYILARTLEGVIHSHPTKLLSKMSSPSKADMQSQMSTNVPWGIIDLDAETINDPYWFGDFLLDETLYGQPFHAGIRDCYSFIRKWYWQKRKLKLKEFPRDDMWWLKEGEDLYATNFESQGFKRISVKELQDGDAVLGKVNSDKINHGGIFLSNNTDGIGLLGHHLYGRLSCRESANRWLSHLELCLRYTDAS